MYFFPNLWTQTLSRSHKAACQEKIKIKENDNLFEISLQAFGLSLEDINLELIGHTLKVQSSTDSEANLINAKLLWQEFEISTLDHRFNIPSTANLDEINARLSDGILKIDIPKLSPNKRSIKINE